MESKSIPKNFIENDFDHELMNYKKDQFDLLFEKFIAIQAENTNILNDYVHHKQPTH